MAEPTALGYHDAISALQARPAVKDTHQFKHEGRTPRSVLPSSTAFNFYNSDLAQEKGGPAAYAKDTRETVYGGRNPGLS